MCHSLWLSSLHHVNLEYSDNREVYRKEDNKKKNMKRGTGTFRNLNKQAKFMSLSMLS